MNDDYEEWLELEDDDEWDDLEDESEEEMKAMARFKVMAEELELKQAEEAREKN